MVFADAGVAYARIPGMPNRIASRGLRALASGCADPDTLADATWIDEVELLTARELIRRYPAAFVFAIVQDPAERIADCYRDLIACEAPLPTFYSRRGFDKTMDLDAFVERICLIGDLRAENHFRSQANILSYKKRLVPELVVRAGSLDADWPALRTAIADRSGRDVGPAPALGAPAEDGLVERLRAGHLFSRLLRRYHNDYRTFFDAKPE
ncbi:DNA topoisomerase IV subunit B [Polymorphum gilvum]|uniref:DNA topoisomerase IV subunit B n=1 Tax=Polymorphum gilvum (strain LMG 25793 / CGMCC 1.9160 / SL003B-26A1) TaxID=991905 RepID=F2J0U2_POLGS|nr:DNA topoisomerase IV subunit B [Polymorphum gilvum]ADZ70778.1 DNA topoisomerase IV subunit B [Polymorphum gilvum SL003B-26A1]